MNDPAIPGGWLDSLRRLGESVLALARGRLEIFAVELQEEKLRVINLIVWLGLALTLGVAGLLIGMGALALWLWSAFGYLGLILLMLGALAGAAGILSWLRSQIQSGPPPFAETVAEFRKDKAWLRKN